MMTVDNLRKVYFAVLDIDPMTELSYQELKEEFNSMKELPPSAPNQTYVTGKNSDDEYIIFIFDIPKGAKRLFKFHQRSVIRKYCKPSIKIMAKLHQSLAALMVYENLEEIELIIPDQITHYRYIFRTVIATMFDIIDERYDPESGEGYIHVRSKINPDDITIKGIFPVGKDDEDE